MRLHHNLICLLITTIGVSSVYLKPALAQKQPTVEKFDIEQTACNDLVLNGVKYQFTSSGQVPNTCSAGAYLGTRDSNNVEAPNIEGYGPGVLTLTFQKPTKNVGFGVYQFGTSKDAVELERLGSARLQQEIPLTLKPDPLFLGGRFEYAGPPVKSIKIRFENAAQFAIDNVTYFRAPGRSKK